MKATEKKVPQNPKYANVQSSIDTGASARKVTTVSEKAVAKRRDEIFKRIKQSTLARLIKENEQSESIYALGGDDGPVDDRASAASVAGGVSVAGTMISQVGSVVSVCETDVSVQQAKSMLLLDVREPDEFAACHIQSAQNYPMRMLAQDRVTPELHRFKSESDKLLVIYHNTDRSTADPATTFIEKGFQNVYAVSGGLQEFFENYPECCEGDFPGTGRPPTGGSAVSRGTAKSAAKSMGSRR
mmetsp:Transcript_2404/g.3674  ORF Transcript_2404/g.3674 Transcript_2404/m.3674 type:complete len:243 (-) Transcript_2404:124-852(-)